MKLEEWALDYGSYRPYHGQLIGGDLESLGVEEIASMVWETPSAATGDSPYREIQIAIATNRGLFVYYRTAGWDKRATRMSDSEVQEPWQLTGSFVPWEEVSDVSVQLEATYDETLEGRIPRRTLQIGRPDLKVAEPMNRPEKAAWKEFVTSVLERLAERPAGGGQV